MKKISFILLSIVLVLALTGCGGDKITSSTCTTTSDGVTYTYKYSATNDEIDKIEMTLVFENSTFGVDSLDILTDDQKEQIKVNMLSTLGLDSSNYEGFSFNIDIQDKMIVTVVADLKIADPEVLNKIGLDFSNTDMSLKNAVKDMKESGAVCE